MMNKIQSRLCLLFALLIFSQPLALAESATQEKVRYGEPYSYGIALEEAFTERSLTTIEDGKPVTVVAVSTAADTIVQVIDLNEEKIIRSFHVETGGGTYGYMYYGTVDTQGVVYMGLGRHLVIYDPQEKQVRKLGEAPTVRSGIIQGMTVDPETGILYGAVSGAANLFQYNPADNQITTLCSLSPECNGTSYAAQLGDFVYTGGGYAGAAGGGTHLYRVNKHNGTKEALPDPTAQKVTGVGYIYAGGKYIFAQMTLADGTTNMFIWNTQTQSWEEKTFRIHTSGMTDLDDEGRYWFLWDGYFHTIDTESLEITDYPEFTYGSHLRGNGMFVELDDPALPGKSFVTAQYNGNIYVFNPATQQTKQVNVILEGGGIANRISRMEEDGRIYVSGFKGSKGAALDPQTGEIEYFAEDQGEGQTSADGKVYIGYYSGAKIIELDTTRPYSLSMGDKNSDGNPKLICDLSPWDQDRPFGMDVAGNYLLVGTLPKAGTLGGALTVIDLATYEFDVYRNLIEDQAILTVTHKDSIVYCGTTVTGGMSSTPSTTRAHVFSFDLETRQIVNDVEFRIPGVAADIGGVHGLRFGPNGDLYGTTAGIDFIMDPETLEIKKYHVYDDNFNVATGFGSQIWHEYYMEFDERTGYLFRTGAILDPTTLEILCEDPGLGQFAGLDHNGNAYFAGSDTEIFRVPVIVGDDDSYLVSGMTYFEPGQGKYYQGAEEIAAEIYEDNGRIMVPVRAFSNLMGAHVAYEAETQTVTVTGDSQATLSFRTGSNLLYLSGVPKKMGVTLSEKDGVSYIPLYTLTEFLGWQVICRDGVYILTNDGDISQEAESYILETVR